MYRLWTITSDKDKFYIQRASIMIFTEKEEREIHEAFNGWDKGYCDESRYRQSRG